MFFFFVRFVTEMRILSNILDFLNISPYFWNLMNNNGVSLRLKKAFVCSFVIFSLKFYVKTVIGNALLTVFFFSNCNLFKYHFFLFFCISVTFIMSWWQYANGSVLPFVKNIVENDPFCDYFIVSTFYTLIYKLRNLYFHHSSIPLI